MRKLVKYLKNLKTDIFFMQKTKFKKFEKICKEEK